MATWLPMANATLTAITGEGFSADGDLPPSPGATKWSGTSDAYVKERKVTSVATGRLDLFDKTQIVIPADLRPSVDVQRGDTVTFSYAGATRTRTVRDITAAMLPGVDGTVRLDLEDT